jgi:hypothetical protein
MYRFDPKYFIKVVHKLLTFVMVLFVIAILKTFTSYLSEYETYNELKWKIYTVPERADFIFDKMPDITKRYSRFNTYPFVPEVQINSGYLKYKLRHDEKLEKVLNFILTNLHLVLIYFIILLLRRTVASVDDKKPFHLMNIRRINIVALLMCSISLIQFLNTIFNHWYIRKSIELTNHVFTSELFFLVEPSKFSRPANQILLSNQYSLNPIIYALLFFLIAVAFREGQRLKTDNDSIL